MSGHLFPVKLLHLFTELKNAKVLEELEHRAKAIPVQCPDDSLTRITLTSPEVQQAVAAILPTKYFRVRIAFPGDLDFLRLAQLSQLEVYSADGEALRTPIQLTEMESKLANAVQVELFHELLRAKGSSIPLL